MSCMVMMKAWSWNRFHREMLNRLGWTDGRIVMMGVGVGIVSVGKLWMGRDGGTGE